MAAPGEAANAQAARSGPDYQKPSWAGRPAFTELAVELIVRGEVRQRIPLDVQEHDAFLIGREKTCDVVLEGFEKRASRYHCVLQCKEGSSEIYLYDLKSSHGTVLNGKQIDPCKFEPLRVGSQLRFNAVKPSPNDCTAVLCGPEEVMEDEGEIDLTEFREEAAKERAQKEKEMLEDLRRRKAAKKQKMHAEVQRKLVAQAYASKAEQKMQALKEAEAKDREKIQEVNWGMGEDAVEIPQEDLHEDAKTLMDANGKLDLEKVRKLELTPKQVAMVEKLEQKQKKLANHHREKQRLEEQATMRARKKAEAEYDIDEMVDGGAGSQNLERLQKLEEKMDKAEEDFAMQADNLLLSLGLKKAGFAGAISKKRAALYDTSLNDDSDDYFDRTAVQRAAPERSERGVHGEDEEIPSELIGLPTLDGVENRKSLEVKVGQLKAEKAKLTALIAAEKVKAKQRAAMEEPEDSLDAFMNATHQELRQDRGDKMERRFEAVTKRLADFEAMLLVAKQNNDDAAPARETGKAATATRATASTASAASAAKPAATPAATATTPATAATNTATTSASEDAAHGTSAAGKASSRTRAPAPEGSTAAALARLLQKSAADEAPSEEGAAGAAGAASEAAAEATADEQTAQQSASTPAARARRGPERPTAAMLAQATSPAEPAKAPAADMQPPAVPVRQARPGPTAHLNPEKAGLQLMGAKRPAAEGAAGEGGQAPKQRKVYGVAMPPARMASSSRDADQGASGELDDPEG